LCKKKIHKETEEVITIITLGKLPASVTQDAEGHLYVAEYYDNKIRKIDAYTNELTTLCGSIAGDSDGSAETALFRTPSGVAVDGEGNVFIADQGNHKIKKYIASTNEVITIAGITGSGFRDGVGKEAHLSSASNVVIDSAMYTLLIQTIVQ